ncbi:MAG: DUF4174 domain-containing protein [Burkholderiales bacterium]|nr:DUF4174 domain-containing protein [Burkholderiales bacterium]
MIIGWPSIVWLMLVSLVAWSPLSWSQSDPLSKYRWDRRPLLVFAADAEDPSLKQLRVAIEAASCEIADRDMVIGFILDRGESRLDGASMSPAAAEAIRSSLRVKRSEFSAVLVGKDGGAKARYGQAPSLDAVFSLIDSMPMRRTEMRKKSAGCEQH